jgi:type I restriction enzyme S subunit
MASGSTVLNLNKEKVAQVTIAVPSIVEQCRISKILSGIDKKIESEQAILNKYTLIKKGLMEKLLNEK